MSLKQIIPTNGGDYIQFGNATTPVAAQVGGYEDSTGNGHLELYTTAGGVSSEKARLDSAGNLGLGVTPSAWSVFKPLQLPGYGFVAGSTVANRMDIGVNAYYNGTNYIYSSSAASSLYLQSGSYHAWYTAPSGTAGNAITFTQAMTLDSSGNLLVGTTSQIGNGVLNIGTYKNGSAVTGLMTQPSTNANYDAAGFKNSAGTYVGYIGCTASVTVYSTTSDYRLKENIAPMTDALAKVQALKPCTYTWKSTGEAGEGFIAHELAEVCPDAVTKEKDEVDADGNPVYQGIDTSFLVATLTAAIQEQQAMISELKAEVDALKAGAK